MSIVPSPAEVTVRPWWLCSNDTPDRSWLVCRPKAEDRKDGGLWGRLLRPHSGNDAERAGSRAVRSARKAPESMFSTESGNKKKESQGHESYSRGLAGYLSGSANCSRDALRRSTEDDDELDALEEEVVVAVVEARCLLLYTRLGTAETDADRGIISLAHSTITTRKLLCP